MLPRISSSKYMFVDPLIKKIVGGGMGLHSSVVL